jgi:microcystin-dependent protein
MNPMIGTIILFAGNYAPDGWAFCDGSELPTNTNGGTLFSIIGDTYGTTSDPNTFLLPDLRGRVPLAPGTGPGLSNYYLGQGGGQERHALITSEMPSHTHSTSNGEIANQHIKLSTDDAVNETPAAGDVPAVANYTAGVATQKVKAFGPATNLVNGQTITGSTGPTILNTGNGLGHNNMQPYLSVNYIIAIKGLFPNR